MEKLKKSLSVAGILLFVVLIFGLIGCESNIEDDQTTSEVIQTSDLMRGIAAREVDAVTINDQFRKAAVNFSLDLFRATISDDKNTLISPTSVLLALAMATNGADGNTLSQMERVIGGGMRITELNAYLYSFLNGLTSQHKSILNISNSIWFRENGFLPNRDFLQTNADYFKADAFAAPFNEQTVIDINNWIDQATDGLIKKMLDSIPAHAVIYLINTVLFDAEWARIYSERNVRSGQFTDINNQKNTADFMYSTEFIFMQGGGATGFIKPYYGNNYSFAAILPDEGINIHDFVESLTGETFLNLIENARWAQVMAALPKFEYEYEVTMNDALIALGMNDAFCPFAANVSRMGTAALGNLFISNVKHKANIAVDERGTKAGAATVIEGGATSVPQYVYVTLDRPFLYAIIDNATSLPIFIGTLLSIP